MGCVDTDTILEYLDLPVLGKRESCLVFIVKAYLLDFIVHFVYQPLQVMMSHAKLAICYKELFSMHKTVNCLYDEVELFLLVKEDREDSLEPFLFDLKRHYLNETLEGKV